MLVGVLSESVSDWSNVTNNIAPSTFPPINMRLGQGRGNLSYIESNEFSWRLVVTVRPCGTIESWNMTKPSLWSRCGTENGAVRRSGVLLLASKQRRWTMVRGVLQVEE